MGKLIFNKDAQIQCIHQGIASIASPGETRLTIKGKKVFTVVTGTVNSVTCTQQPTPANPSFKPCSTFSVSTGTATKLTIGGKPVILLGDQGTTDGSPTNGCAVKNAGQSIFSTV